MKLCSDFLDNCRFSCTLLKGLTSTGNFSVKERCCSHLADVESETQSLSVALTEPKTSEDLVSFVGIYSSGSKRLFDVAEIRLVHRFLLLQLSQGEG